MTPSFGPTLAAAVRVVNGVHGRTPDMGSPAQPAASASLADGDILVVQIADLANRGPAVLMNHPDFRGREPHLSIVSFFGQDLSTAACGLGDLAALILPELDVVNNGPQRDEAQGHGVSGEYVHLGIRGDNRLTELEVQRRQNVASLSVPVFDKGDESGTVRVILDCFDGTRNVDFVPFEIHGSVHPLVTASAVPYGHMAA